MSARDVIAETVRVESHYVDAPTTIADAILSALRAMPDPDRLALARELAGPEWAVVPREPTREMWAASGNALVNGRVKIKAHHDYLSETVWTAMLAASEKETP